MQVWTQRVTDNTNKEMAEVTKEMNEKLEKMMRDQKTVEEPKESQVEKVMDKLRRE